nr:1576_t:CDS:2 [Entrophospora candida]
MNLGGVCRNPSKRCSPKKPVKKPGKGKHKKKHVGAINTIDDRYYYQDDSEVDSEVDSEDSNTESEEKDETNYGLISKKKFGITLQRILMKSYNHVLILPSNQPSIVRQETADMQQMQPLPTETYNPEWLNPMQIGLIKRLPPNNVSTIPCEIVLPNGELFYIPEVWSDTWPQKEAWAKSDKTRTIELDKIGTITRTLGTVSGLGDFDEGLLLILGVPWLDKACALPDISSHKCIIRYSDKEITIPLSFPYPSKLKAHFSRKTSCTTGNALSSNGNFSEDLSSAGNALSSAGNFSEDLSSAKNLTNYEKDEMVPIRLTMA